MFLNVLMLRNLYIFSRYESRGFLCFAGTPHLMANGLQLMGHDSSPSVASQTRLNETRRGM